MLTIDLLTNATWRYGRTEIWHLSNVIRFLDDGRITGMKHDNEHSWRVQDGTLSIHHIDGRVTVRFDEVIENNGVLTLQGKFQLAPEANIVLVLQQLRAGGLTIQTVPPPAMTAASLSNARLLVVLPFHYRDLTLQYLLCAISGYQAYHVQSVDIVVQSNAIGAQLSKLQDALAVYDTPPGHSPVVRITVESFPDLEDPWHLVWQHKPMISRRFAAADGKYTHFIFSEDDIRIDFHQFLYFVKYREALKPLGLLPSFCVTECTQTGRVHSKEQFRHIDIAEKTIAACDGLWFINHTNPYAAVYILDHELAAEYIGSDSIDIERSKNKSTWWIAERSAMGLCFENIPAGYQSRYVIPVVAGTGRIPPFALAQHLPNKYCNMPDSPIAKIPLSELFLNLPAANT